MRPNQVSWLREIRAERLAHWVTGYERWLQVDARFPTIALARALDHEAFQNWTFNKTIQTSGGLVSLFHGWPLAIAPFQDALSSYLSAPGTPLFVGDDESEQWAAQALRLCASIRELDRLIERGADENDVGPIRSAGNPLGREIQIIDFTPFAAEGYRDDLNSVRKYSRSIQRSQLKRLIAERPKILAAMRKVTAPVHQHFPSYRSTPAIESWYFRLGELLVQRMTELWLVGPGTLFGGLELRTYVEAVADQVAFSLKHLDHAVILREMDATLRWSNILTITQDIEETTDIVKSRQRVSQADAERIVAFMTWEPNPNESGSSGPVARTATEGLPPPVLIRTSSNQHLRLVCGALGEPITYVLMRLRDAYPDDWANADGQIRKNLRERVSDLVGKCSTPRRTDTNGSSVTVSHDDSELELRAIVEKLDIAGDPADSKRDILSIVGLPVDRTLTCKVISEQEAICSFAWFLRTMLQSGPPDVAIKRLWSEATGKRQQLRIERLPSTLQIQGETVTVTLSSWFGGQSGNAEADLGLTDGVATLREAVEREEAALRDLGSGIDQRLVVACLVSGADRRMSAELALRARVGTEADASALRISPLSGMRLAFGYPRALGLYASEMRRSSWPPKESAPVVADFWATAVALKASNLVEVDQALALVVTGLATLSQTGPNEWTVQFPSGTLGVEAQERDHWLAFVKRTADIWKDVQQRLERTQKGLTKKILKHVSLRRNELSVKLPRKMRRHFIDAAVYGTHQMLGADSFPGEVLFGGVPFGAYRLIVVGLASEALARLTASEAFAQTDPTVDLGLINTSGWRIPILTRLAGSALNLSDSDAEQAINALALDEEFAKTYRGVSRAPSPPLIRTAPDHVIMSAAGCLDEPFQFLLLRLRELYPLDWDKAVDHREEVFRQELYRALTHATQERFVNSQQAVKLRAEGRVLTDVDAAIYDRETQELGLFQLKWQEAFGASLTRRASSAKNFTVPARKWVETVARWVEAKSPSEIREHFRLGDGSDLPIRVRLFVLGRFAAHFTEFGQPDDRSAWGTWPQVLNLAASTHESASIAAEATMNPIAWLDQQLRLKSPFRSGSIGDERIEVVYVGGIRLVVKGFERVGDVTQIS
jgi:hypothetical protein